MKKEAYDLYELVCKYIDSNPNYVIKEDYRERLKDPEELRAEAKKIYDITIAKRKLMPDISKYAEEAD